MSWWATGVLLVSFALRVHAQNPPSTGIRILTNREALLSVTATNTSNITLRVYSPLLDQSAPLLTFRSTGANNHIDSAAPYLSSRFYTTHYAAPNALTGDHLTTTNGEIVIHPVTHASFVMSWNGKMIYNDPVGAASLYAGIPKADLILISHDHSDHFSTATINAVTNATTRIISSQNPYNAMPAALRNITTVLTYGTSNTVMGVTVEAVRAWNAVYHPEPANNAYVTTIAGRRILTTGDTGATAELRALRNIDVAFVAMNLPYTMDVATAASLVRDMGPKVVFPYHFGTLGGSPTSDVQMFKRLVANDLGIEVRLRKWY